MTLDALTPATETNRRLESLVHPADWQNPTPDGRYNLVVIGAGTAGLVTAAGAAGLGAKVALVERSLMGGDCLNVGCVPSKAIIHSARQAAAVREASRFGIHPPGDPDIRFHEVMDRMRRLRADIAPNDSVERFSHLGIDVYLGEARFLDGHRIDVAGVTLPFAKAAICTGARASAPPIPGLDTVDYLTNETLFSLTERPRRFGIIGGGPIGCEMAQTFARLGSHVTLFEAADRIMTQDDMHAAQIVHASLEKDGVTLLCNGKNLKIAKRDTGIRLQVESRGENHDIEVDQLLVAAGRAPNIEGLNLEAAGVESTPKGIGVNDRQQTTHKDIYAAGDVCSPYQFTHAADFMARNLIQNALFFGRAKNSGLVIPWSTYTEPEVAQVGLTADTAEQAGIEIDTYTQPLQEVDRAILEERTEGFVRIHVRKGTDHIVGATAVAANAGDLIAPCVLAMTHGLGLKQLSSAIFPYPTQAEAVRKIGDLYNRTRLTPRVHALMKRFLAWRR